MSDEKKTVLIGRFYELKREENSDILIIGVNDFPIPTCFVVLGSFMRQKIIDAKIASKDMIRIDLGWDDGVLTFGRTIENKECIVTKLDIPTVEREAHDDIESKSQTLEDFLEHNFVPGFDDIWIKTTIGLFRKYWQGEITLEELKSRYPKMLGDEFVERFSFFLEEYKDQH